MIEIATVEISNDILASLRVGIKDLIQYMRLTAATAYFQDKKLSLGKAAELAGMNRLNFMDILSRQGIVIFDYDESELRTELAGIDQLL